MSEEIIYTTINEKIEKMGYKSALLRLALLKEGNSWKIYLARMILDMQKPSGQKTLVKTENFALEDFSLSVDDFHNFLEFLKKSYVGNIVFSGTLPRVSEEHFYKIGDYKLCFVGNFPGRELYFFRREIGMGHGIDRPLYFIDYSIHQSVRLLNYLNVDLTSHEIPFRDALDAINHFWQVKYEAYQASSTSFPFYFPVYDASIVSCSFTNNKLIVKVDVDNSIAKRNELSLSVIVEKKPGFRKKFPVDTNTIEIPLSFEPDYATIYLTKNTEKIDEYYYRSDYAIKKEDEILASINNTSSGETYVNEKSLRDLHVEKTSIKLKNNKKTESEVMKLTMEFITTMWKSGKFSKSISLWDIQNFAKSEGYTFTKRTITSALKKLDFIAYVGKHSNGVPIYSQTYPSKPLLGNDDPPKHIQIFESLELHSEIKNASARLFKDGHYTQAITEALKKVNNMVKSKSGKHDLDGKTLMLNVFSPNSPVLKLNQLRTITEKDEQEGFMHLFAGSIQGIRNPKVHDEITQDDPFKTLEYLCLASLLAKTIDMSIR